MPVTRNQAINEEKEELPDSGEEGGEEQGGEKEESYLPKDAEDAKDAISGDEVGPPTRAPAPAQAPRREQPQQGRSQARQTTNAHIDNLMEVMETMMDRLSDMEVRISGPGGGSRQGQRNRREDG